MKRIVVLCDGTWDRLDRAGAGGLTNVAHLHNALPKESDGVRQVIAYAHGIGSLSRGPLRWFEGLTGYGIGRNIRKAYRRICENHEDDDEIWLFGFSRGAYTVRSLAGMLRSCGVVKDPSAAAVRQAYRQYRNHHHPSCAVARRWRAENSRVDAPGVHFMGVWDTVGSLGIPYGRLRRLTQKRNQFHDVRISSSVRHAYHAVAIDEQRTSFQPTLWARGAGDGQVVEQHWFTGVHRDVGGGHVDGKKGRTTGLSDVAFRWMAERAREAKLQLDWDYVEAKTSPRPLVEVEVGRMGRLQKWFWSLRPHVRYIGDPRIKPQEVAPAATDRFEHEPCRYRPDNLRRYLEEGPVYQPGVEPPAPAPDCRRDRCQDLNSVTEPPTPNPPAPSPIVAR